jgi:hypothetical protein
MGGQVVTKATTDAIAPLPWDRRLVLGVYKLLGLGVDDVPAGSGLGVHRLGSNSGRLAQSHRGGPNRGGTQNYGLEMADVLES